MCEPSEWCGTIDDLTVPDQGGVCRPTECVPLAQDCGWDPAAACAPVDLDAARCVPAGRSQPGETCALDDPWSTCAAGSVCSAFDGTCHAMCDPAAGDNDAGCGDSETCFAQGAWPFGLCD